MAQFNFFTFFDRGVEIHVRDRSVVGSKPVNGFCVIHPCLLEQYLFTRLWKK